MKTFFQMLFVLAVIALAVWLAVSDWQECRDVGHSWFYCFRHMGNK